jgi:ASC-1-like (ASCH) protein
MRRIETMMNKMNLNPEPFKMICSGQKTIELRLNDEKRQKINVGDSIEFTQTETGEKLTAEVIAIHRFDSFAALYQKLPLLKCGYKKADIETAKPEDMDLYYTPEQQAKYGVLGIEIKIIGVNMINQLPVWEKLAKVIIWNQIGELKDKTILDFGSGTGITADHFAADNQVTAIEPSEDMLAQQVNTNGYRQIFGSIDELKKLPSESFDYIFCHNVLEYIENREAVLDQLVRVVKPEGILSIVKHNLLGRVMGSAVLADDPNVALEVLNNISEDSMFGNRSVYSNELLIETLSHDMKLSDSYGIRTFFGLSSNNEIKYTNEWYQSMLALEIKTSTMEEFKKIAFFNHLIFKKETNKQ